VRTAGIDLVQVVDPREATIAPACACKIPLDNGWGLSDCAIEDRNGEEMGHLGEPPVPSLATVSPLGWGHGTVTIGPEGLGEWRRVPGSALTLAGVGAWYLYDAGFALLDRGLKEGAVGAVAGGSYLLLHGAPHTTITLTVKP